MSQSFHICGICGDIFSDYSDGYEWCEGCGIPMCCGCVDESYDVFIREQNEEAYIIECPNCDPFKHMGKEYEC